MRDYHLKYLLTKNTLSVLEAKCTVFRNMIQDKNPDRKELIESFEFSRTECNEALLFLDELDKDYLLTKQRAFDLETICLKLQAENDQLKKANEQLINNVDI